MNDAHPVPCQGARVASRSCPVYRARAPAPVRLADVREPTFGRRDGIRARANACGSDSA